MLHNAIKFTDSGQIAVTGFVDARRLLIRVVDSGRGIAEKDMARVFERFNTVGHRAGASERIGAGVGAFEEPHGTAGGDHHPPVAIGGRDAGGHLSSEGEQA